MVAIKFLTVILTYAVSICGVFPLLPWLTTTPRIFLALGLLCGIWQDRRGIWPLKPWIQNCAIVPVFIYYALQYSRSNPIEPVVSVLAIMLAVRLGGEKTVRHSLQIQALSLFCLASSSLFDLSPMFLVYLGLLLFMVAVALVLTTFVNQDDTICLSRDDLKKVLTAGFLMPLLSLPLLLFFFPLLPRTQLPLWNYLSTTAGHASRLSDKVEPGSESALVESRVLAFRAELPRQSRQLYWRGTVFNQVEGNRWVRASSASFEKMVLRGHAITQNIYPEPTGSRILVALDRPSSMSLKYIKQSPDGVFEYLGSIRRRLNYSAISVIEDAAASSGSIDKAFFLRLPATVPARIQQLAADIRNRGKSDRGRLDLLETYFRNGGYRYSTSGLPTGYDALENFLFGSRQGHCEFFASSFAILLRGAGVPSRLVGGYLGGEYNDLGGYYLITENMAHVWVEAFIEGSGWIRIDPSSFAENAGNIFGVRNPGNLLLRLRLIVDSVNHAWNRTVIPYDFERQIDFVNYVSGQLQAVHLTDTVRKIAIVLTLTALIAFALFAVKRKLFFRCREERLLRSFFRRAGVDCGLSGEKSRMGLFEIAEKSGSEKMKEFVTVYAGAVYRDRRLTDEEYRTLRQILRGGFSDNEEKTDSANRT